MNADHRTPPRHRDTEKQAYSSFCLPALRSLRFGRFLASAVALALLSTPALADKKKPVPLMVRPGQAVDLPALPAVAARQKCENWAWAAALEGAVYVAAGASLPQGDWVLKAGGTEACLDVAPTPEQMRRAAEGEYGLEDGRKLRLELRFRPGAPTTVDDLIVAVQQRRPPLVFWRGHAYLLAGLTYDEFIAPTGSRFFEVRELRLLDPLAALDKKAVERLVTFVRNRDDPAEIDGVLEVITTVRR